jgi:hypothetical protein
VTRHETALLLGLAAARDYRTIGEIDVAAWHQDLADIDFADAREAVSRHYRESTDRLMPAHIRRHVKAIRADRAKATAEPLALPSRFEDDLARDLRMEPGLASCREVLAAIAAHANRLRADRERTPSELIHDRARERAIADRAERRRTA